MLYVYSDSPKWKEHIEENILPVLPENTSILNFSHRNKWNTGSIEARAFAQLSGESEYCPIGMVFRPFKWVSTYRFFHSYRELKHGKPEKLKAKQQAFIEELKSNAL